ncbi:hypothetical protein F4559_005827 [Saccharothrix violaceirubra]|uniref:Uncharacterized protein n=1 Tax=Saccharothrix violaceirubra TaxID=413306 RepID=A0A7W7T8F3_9PSEU|nr:hypothetical protein [Saccharothrix violaceirubra]
MGEAVGEAVVEGVATEEATGSDPHDTASNATPATMTLRI